MSGWYIGLSAYSRLLKECSPCDCYSWAGADEPCSEFNRGIREADWRSSGIFEIYNFLPMSLCPPRSMKLWRMDTGLPSRRWKDGQCSVCEDNARSLKYGQSVLGTTCDDGWLRHWTWVRWCPTYFPPRRRISSDGQISKLGIPSCYIFFWHGAGHSSGERRWRYKIYLSQHQHICIGEPDGIWG